MKGIRVMTYDGYEYWYVQIRRLFEYSEGPESQVETSHKRMRQLYGIWIRGVLKLVGRGFFMTMSWQQRCWLLNSSFAVFAKIRMTRNYKRPSRAITSFCKSQLMGRTLDISRRSRLLYLRHGHNKTIRFLHCPTSFTDRNSGMFARM